MNRIFYNTYSSFLKKTFGYKVYKIPLSINVTCPNRDGIKARGGCIYCSDTGSGIKSNLNALEQVNNFLKKRNNKNEKYLPYFQAFSNMYGKIDYLINEYKSVFINEKIIGISIGTRPDTVNEEILEHIAEIEEKYFIQIELGLESANNITLQKLNRQDIAENFPKAIDLIKKYLKNPHIVGHIIIGLPDENYSDYEKSTKFVFDSGAHGIKFHNLYIEKSMPIYQMYINNQIQLMEEKEYIDIILHLLELLPSDIIIHRLKSISGRELIAPEWTNDKFFYEKLHLRAKELKSYQGKKYGNNHFNCW